MNEILPFLFLGGVRDAENSSALHSNGIVAIVNCCTFAEYPASLHLDSFEYLRIDVEDVSREPIHLYFDEANDFLESFVCRQKAVLVHCKAGVSRSATIVLSYLVKSRGFRLQEAFFHLLSKRREVCPNIGFIEQLCDYEENLLGERSVCAYRYIDWYSSDSLCRAAIPNLDP